MKPSPDTVVGDGGRLPLSPRLAVLASYVRRGSMVADIGCDHGKLICSLGINGTIKSGLACDINEAPLMKARALIEERGLSAVIRPVLCNGLSGIECEKADDIIIAGMGGETIADIILSCGWARCGDKRYILQPMTRPELLRSRLSSAGFMLLREEGVRSKGRLYSVMLWQYLGEPRALSPLEAAVGALPDSQTNETTQLLTSIIRRLEAERRGILKSVSNDRHAEAQELHCLIKQLKSLAASR